MKQNKNEFKCVYEFESVYGYLVLSIWSFFMAILMVLMMIIDRIFGITIALCCFFVVVSIVSFIKSLSNRDKKFIINHELCKVESKKGDLYATKLKDIRRIVDLESSRGKRYIIIDCEAYPFVAAMDLFWNKVIYIKYTSRRLREIRKYCTHCIIERERTNYFVTEKRD